MAAVVRSSKFRHVFGKTVRKEDQYENVQCNASAPDSYLVDANSKYVCLPWRGGGGPFVVWPLNKTGRLPQQVPLCTGHSGTVMDLHFNPFVDECVASASDDTTAKVWMVPEGGPTEDIEKERVSLVGHHKKVIQERWNPIAANVLATVSYDNTIKIWDVEHSGAEKLSFEQHTDAIQSFDWNYNGSLYGTYCKDKKIRLVDPVRRAPTRMA
jgi:WD40 repeat protein